MTTLTHDMTPPAALGRPLAARRLLARLLSTDGSVTALVLRLALGAVLVPHGAQHLFGAFGGSGFTATVAWISGTLSVPAPVAAAGILLEFFGPLLLIAGAATRPVAAALALFMAAAASTHLGHGFFMNWFGTLPAGAEGFEYHILAIALALAIARSGAGALSVDRLLASRDDTAR